MAERKKRDPRDARGAFAYLTSFLELPETAVDEGLAVFRRALEDLGCDRGETGVGALEGVSPSALAAAVRAGIDRGYFDDLGFLSDADAGRAVYALAASLPLGTEQRELGRRALGLLLGGNASTFAALATTMADFGGRGLSSPAVVARTALLFELPLSLEVRDGPLALTLATRKHLARDWILTPSPRSLAARRFVARLVERAACELARRFQQRSSVTPRFFKPDGHLEPALRRLLADRESLVWRHVAVARGVGSIFDGDIRAQIEAGIDETLSPTEWRRSATAIAAMGTVDPDGAVRLARALFESSVVRVDPGVAQAFVWGLSRTVVHAPETARHLFELAGRGAPEEIGQGVIYLLREVGQTAEIERFREAVLARGDLVPSGARDDADGALALRREIQKDLDPGRQEDKNLQGSVDAALVAYAREGARRAREHGLDVLRMAAVAVDVLGSMSLAAESNASRGAALAVLRDVDVALLERDVVMDLVRLDSSSERVRTNEEAYAQLRERLASFLLDREARPEDDEEGMHTRALTLRLARLRALLHLVDSDALGSAGFGVHGNASAADDAARTSDRTRFQRVAGALIERVAARPPRSLRRALLATVARALDGLVRNQTCDVVDALVVVAARMNDVKDFETLAEAAMDPDLRAAFSYFGAFLRGAASLFDVKQADFAANLSDARIAGLGVLASALASLGSTRSESAGQLLERLGVALAAVQSAPSLRALCRDGEADALVALENTVFALKQLCLGAAARVLDRVETRPPTVPRRLSTAASRALGGAEDELDGENLTAIQAQLAAHLPRSIAALLDGAVREIASLPIDGGAGADAYVALADLPSWLPPRRVLGAYHVIRGLGSGAAGSVFVVSRAEDRRDPNAERFALKVPDYSGNVARHLSEAEFFDMFRSEASALLALPQHQNLARCVTFDLAARPRPILVMELVRGPNLEYELAARSLDVRRALRILDEVLAGLEAMHAVGVGHLDIKPENVVLRDGATAVLVDFGLAGRTVKPGCASGPYGAPEIWVDDESQSPAPAADIYAFACLAYELLTGDVLFDSRNQVTLVASHLAHDGLPPKLKAAARKPGFAELTEILFKGLRRSPADRSDAATMRKDLARLGRLLDGAAWPLGSKGSA